MNRLDNKGKPLNRKLFGTTGNENRSIELSFIPCVPKQITDYNRYLEDKECLADYKDPKSL